MRAFPVVWRNDGNESGRARIGASGPAGVGRTGWAMTAPRIVGLGGSLRAGSASLVALRAALDAAQAAGAETRLLDLRELALPLYRPDLAAPADYGTRVAPRIEHLLAVSRWADGFIWASPAYHGSMSGALKNALDYLEFLRRDDPPYLHGRVVGLVGVGSGAIGAINVLTQLTHVAHALRASVVPLAVPITGAGRAIRDGAVIDAAIARRLDGMARELVALARTAPPRPLNPGE